MLLLYASLFAASLQIYLNDVRRSGMLLMAVGRHRLHEQIVLVTPVANDAAYAREVVTMLLQRSPEVQSFLEHTEDRGSLSFPALADAIGGMCS